MNFQPSKKYFKCKRCRKRVKRKASCEKYCDKCKPIMERKTIERSLEKQRKDRGKKRKCRGCGVKIPRYRSYCAGCRGLNFRESQQRTKIEKARLDLIKGKEAYNIKELRELNPEKFGKAVSKCLQGEATIVGVR